MKNIIAIQTMQINTIGVKAVNSRDIHAYVESKRQYADWIKTRLEDLGAIANEDYILISQKNENGNNRPLKDYIVTLDIAKHLAMMERNDKGREVRQYFIEVEKEANKPMTIEQLLEHNTKMIADLRNNVITLEHKIEEDKPKVSYATAVVGSINPVSIRDWISALKSDTGLQAGERKVIAYLLEKKYIYRDPKGNLRAYADYYDTPGNKKGYFSLIPVTTATPKGNREFGQLKVTGLGQLELGVEVVDHFKKGESA